MVAVWLTSPTVVFATLFKSFASASATKSESLQTLPILQAKLSPMVLTSVGGPSADITSDALSGNFSLYTLDNVFVPEKETITTYVVQPGDTISQIAEKFGVSTNTIRWANDIPAKGTIRVGQNLVILPITGVKHAVVKGDTLASIAKKYKADINEISSYNDIPLNEPLVTGSELLIPDGEIVYSQTQIAQNTQKTKPVTSTGSQSVVVSSNAGKSSDAQYTSAMLQAQQVGRNNTKSAPAGYFIKPVKGIKTQGFHGPYNAVDIGAPVGTPIVAAAAGTVILAKASGWNGGYGGLTIIQHDNGSQSLYSHQSKVIVSVGQKVSQGQKIGEVGNTGRSSGPHLHLEFRGVKTPILY